MILLRLKPSPGPHIHIVLKTLCAVVFFTTMAGTQTPADQNQTDDKGIASKNSAQAFQSGSTQASKGAEPGQPTAPKPDTALSILVLPKPLPAEITAGINVDDRSKVILAHLSEVLRFYRMVVTPVQKVGEPSDMLYVQQAQIQATQASQLAFQAARGEAALLARIPSKSTTTQQADSERTQRLNQIRAGAAQRIQDLQQQQQSIQQQLAKARAAQRDGLQQQLEAIRGQLELNNAMADALAKVAGISAAQGGTRLQTDINQLQSSAPELADPKAKPVAHTIENLPARDAGVTSLAGLLFQLLTTERAIDTRIDETQKLHDQAMELRTPLINILRATMEAGQRLQNDPNAAGSNRAETRKRYDELTDAFTAISKVSIPVSQEVMVLDQVRSTLQSWRAAIDVERKTVMQSLLMRVIFIAIALVIVLGVNQLVRRATLRVHDIRRRRQLTLIRRMVVGFFTGVVLLFGFVTQFNSLATFAGFITAGIAVGLQTILLSVAAYFFIVGRYGVKVGDRITVAGVTGDVIDVGLVRFYMMELTGSGTELHPTGRVAVFANSVLFQAGTPLYKQMPGTEYAWHELTVKLKPNTDYRAATQAVVNAITQIYSGYKENIEQQHRRVEAWMDTPIETPRIESRLQLDEGLQFAVLYPVEIRNAGSTDDKIVQAVLDVVHNNQTVAQAVEGSPNVKAVIKG
jgi:small-conductance mechanosensitive channel